MNELLHKKINPLICYAVLGIGLAGSVYLAYQVFKEPLIFFDQDLIPPVDSPFALNRQEYKQALLDANPESVERFIMGKITGRPNFKDNVDKYDALIKQAAKKYRVDCTLIKATMLAESRGRPYVRSGSGAVGLMQLMPSTARAMGFRSSLSDPQTNIMAGASYMAHLKDRACHEKPKNEVCDVAKDIKFRLAAYNGGPKCNNPDWGECLFKTTRWQCEHYDAYEETRQYVERVKANYQELKQQGWGC